MNGVTATAEALTGLMRHRRKRGALLATALAAMAAASGLAEEDFPVIKLNSADTRHAAAFALEFPAGDSNRRFVATRDGKVISMEPVVTFLDISDRVRVGLESGMLGIAFAPDFAETGIFYLNYSPDYTKVADIGNRVSRFRTGDDGLGDPDSEEILLEVPIAEFRSREARNRGGQLAFGKDGYLYIGTGDAEVEPGVGHPSQDLGQLPGKILRIDVMAVPEPGKHYAIPPDNPFVGKEGALPEIWALGLQNPRRFSFDWLTGDLFIADVANHAREEINFQLASSTGGENYGWPYREGDEVMLPSAPDELEFTEPVATYGRSVGRSVCGGFVYRGEAFSSLQGTYIAGDSVSGNFFGVRPVTEGKWLAGPVDVRFKEKTWAFGQDLDGELYSIGGNSSLGRNAIWSLTVSAQKKLRLSPGGGDLNAGREVKVVYGVNDLSMPYLRRWNFHYTTDGSSPSPLSPTAELPVFPSLHPTIRIKESQTLKVQAYRGEIPVTEVVEATYSVQAAAELILPWNPETVSVDVGMRAIPAGSTVRYTLDGSEPNELSALYPGRGTIRVESGDVLRANAFHPVLPTGRSVSFEPGNRVNTPRAEGWDESWRALLPGQPVELVSDARGALVHFNLGHGVSEDSPVFEEPLQLEPGANVSMIAVQNGVTSSRTSWKVSYRIREAATFERIGGAIREPAASWFEADALRMDLLPDHIAVMNNDVVFVHQLEGGIYRIEGGVATLLTDYGSDFAVSSEGLLAISAGSRVFLVDGQNGEEIAILGAADDVQRVDGNRDEVRFAGTRSIDVDSDGNFYVFDGAIRKIDGSDFSVTTWAGGGNTVFNGRPVPKEDIRFDPVFSLAAGADGVYVITHDDRWSPNRLLFISGQDGMVRERAPFQGSGSGINDGLGVGVAFEEPTSLAVDSAGIVYLGGENRAVIRKLYPDDWVTTLDVPMVQGWDGNGEFHDGIYFSGDLSAGPDGVLYATTAIDGGERTFGGVFRIESEDWENDTIPEADESDVGPFVAGRDDRALDQDGDGLSNAVEFHLGLPADTPNPRAEGSGLAVKNGKHFFTARTIPGQTYQLQISTDLVRWRNHLLPFLARWSSEVVRVRGLPTRSSGTFVRLVQLEAED